MNTTTSRKRRFFLPLVEVETNFTYGLAMLKTILLGYHQTITDDELIQATNDIEDPDSPSSLVQIAGRCGLELEQSLLPADHLYLPNALPALVMMRPITEEPPHWAVVWQRLGSFYQVVDPKLGRLWLSTQQLLIEVSSEEIVLSAEEWRAVATAESSQRFLQARMQALQLEPQESEILLRAAYTPANEFGPAILDTALRTVEHVVQNGGFRRGPEAAKAVAEQYSRALTQLVDRRRLLTSANWAVIPELTATDMANSSVTLHGVAALRITGLTPGHSIASAQLGESPRDGSSRDELPTALIAPDSIEINDSKAPSAVTTSGPSIEASSAVIEAVESTVPTSGIETSGSETKIRNALMYLREEGRSVVVIIGMAMLLGGAGFFFQAILFRGLGELSVNLISLERRIWAISLLLLFTLTMTGLKWFGHGAVQRLGHRLDGRLRLAVLAQLPQLSNHYFQDISAGDMIERIHNVRAIRKLPFYMSEFFHIFVQFVMTVIGLLLLDWLGALITFIKLTVPFFFIYYGGYIGSETERTRTYLGFLSRFYLDAMEGLVAIRTHGAEPATRREYEDLLGKWVQSNINVYQGEWRYNVISTALSYGMTALVIFLYMIRDKDPANLLLVAYWSVNLESLRGPLIFLAISYLFDQGKASRFLQLLDAPLEEELVENATNRSREVVSESVTGDAELSEKVTSESVVSEVSMVTTHNDAGDSDTGDNDVVNSVTKRATGLAIALRQVTVVAADQQIFKEVTLTIPPGSQIGIVGPSGAGKSTLVGLLLGWHYPASGELRIDDTPLSYDRLQQLRAETAWVDPTIQLWNRSFLYNLRYGGSRMPLNMVIDQADLRTVLERLPDGMQTKLGGEGRLVSGGEGQRMRFGRGLQRPDARLVILDEPFRGLDREKRRTLLAGARAYWPHATMLCITHDVGQTQDFERVLVVEDGRIIEDDSPQTLLTRSNSRYRALLNAEDAVREQLWSNESWRRLWLENGHVQER